MKVKLLKKVRRKYKILYREEPYDITNGLNRLNYLLVTPVWLDETYADLNSALKGLISQLRYTYPNLGNYNRQRKIKEQEYKVWYNER